MRIQRASNHRVETSDPANLDQPTPTQQRTFAGRSRRRGKVASRPDCNDSATEEPVALHAVPLWGPGGILL